MKVSSIVMATGAAALVAGATSLGVSAQDSKAKQEKCYGVVAKGMNDCASATHSCAGQSAEDAHPEEWVYVPAGLCDRLAGGVSETKKNGG
ncbi:MAG: DUF2282 domain-containing protein [Alphaproteobacteria bacterium]|nr:MAG: DUF2282 domain-containing protein [Alphaproteobacteria bacterium]